MSSRSSRRRAIRRGCSAACSASKVGSALRCRWTTAASARSAGMTLAAAVCAALVALTRTGNGQLVSTSLYRQGAYTVSFDLNTFLMTGHSIAIGQRETMGNPCMNNYTAGDGRRFWIVGLQAGRHWPPLCRAVGRSEWLTDPRYDTAQARAANAAGLIAEL